MYASVREISFSKILVQGQRTVNPVYHTDAGATVIGYMETKASAAQR